MDLNVSRGLLDVASSELREHQRECTKSCTVSGAPICVHGEALIDAAINADANFRYAHRLVLILQYERH